MALPQYNMVRNGTAHHTHNTARHNSAWDTTVRYVVRRAAAHGANQQHVDQRDVVLAEDVQPRRSLRARHRPRELRANRIAYRVKRPLYDCLYVLR